MTAYSTASQLPDPDTQPGFYEGVTTKRFVAWIVDVLIIAAIMVPIIVLTLGLAVFAAPIWMIVSFIYRWMTISSGSATLGMRFMSIELRDAYGKRLDGGQAFLHTIGFFLSMAFFIVQVVSVICMLGSSRGQGVTDMALGTVMLNRRA